MMKSILVLTGAAALLLACRREPVVKVDPKKAAEISNTWNARLASPSDLAGVVQMNGTAKMAPGSGDNSTVVSVQLSNAAPGGEHPWEAHRGQCGQDQGVLGPSEAYEPLKVDSDGRATSSATLPVATPDKGDYFVLVHASGANAETIVACGNLAPPVH